MTSDTGEGVATPQIALTMKRIAESDESEQAGIAPSLLAMRRESAVSGPTSGRATRRRSTLRTLTKTLTGVGLRRMTTTKASTEDMKPRVRLENTYKMAPDEGKTFTEYRIKQTALEVLEQELTGREYDRAMCSQQACDLAVKIKNKVKDMDMKRYKIICKVLIGERKQQSMEFVSRCIWDDKNDNYACATYKNNTISAVAMVYGVYFE